MESHRSGNGFSFASQAVSVSKANASANANTLFMFASNPFVYSSFLNPGISFKTQVTSMETKNTARHSPRTVSAPPWR